MKIQFPWPHLRPSISCCSVDIGSHSAPWFSITFSFLVLCSDALYRENKGCGNLHCVPLCRGEEVTVPTGGEGIFLIRSGSSFTVISDCSGYNTLWPYPFNAMQFKSSLFTNLFRLAIKLPRNLLNKYFIFDYVSYAKMGQVSVDAQITVFTPGFWVFLWCYNL